jgi:acyl carrier protein
MTKDQVLSEVNDIFRDVFDDDTIELSERTTAKDVDEWDSLNNIQLVVAIERHFKIRFSTSQIRSWQNVGEMCAAIEKMVQTGNAGR